MCSWQTLERTARGCRSDSGPEMRKTIPTTLMLLKQSRKQAGDNVKIDLLCVCVGKINGCSVSPVMLSHREINTHTHAHIQAYTHTYTSWHTCVHMHRGKHTFMHSNMSRKHVGKHHHWFLQHAVTDLGRSTFPWKSPPDKQLWGRWWCCGGVHVSKPRPSLKPAHLRSSGFGTLLSFSQNNAQAARKTAFQKYWRSHEHYWAAASPTTSAPWIDINMCFMMCLKILWQTHYSKEGKW